MPDDLSATLAGAKRIANGLQFACMLPGKVPDFTFCGGPAAEAYWNYFTPARISSLLAAIPELADRWEKETARLDGLAETTADPQSRTAISMRAQAFEECARLLREAIGAALTGKDAGDAGT